VLHQTNLDCLPLARKALLHPQPHLFQDFQCVRIWDLETLLVLEANLAQRLALENTAKAAMIKQFFKLLVRRLDLTQSLKVTYVNQRDAEYHTARICTARHERHDVTARWGVTT
jgi:hypothetical protein